MHAIIIDLVEWINTDKLSPLIQSRIDKSGTALIRSGATQFLCWLRHSHQNQQHRPEFELLDDSVVYRGIRLLVTEDPELFALFEIVDNKIQFRQEILRNVRMDILNYVATNLTYVVHVTPRI